MLKLNPDEILEKLSLYWFIGLMLTADCLSAMCPIWAGTNFFSQFLLNYPLYHLKTPHFTAQKHLYGAIYSSGYRIEFINPKKGG